MSTLNAISQDELFRLIGTAAYPTLIDVREHRSQLIPSATPGRFDEVETIECHMSPTPKRWRAPIEPG